MGELNFLDPDFLADPYPVYHRLRTEDPVYRHPFGFYVLARYDDVAAFLRDARFGKSGYQALFEARFGGGPDASWLALSMLFRDPPDHTRLRALVSKAFTPRVIETLRLHVQVIVDRLLEPVTGAGRMDVIAHLAYPLPVTVISELLGVPVGDADAVKGWSRDVARALDAIALPVDPEVIERGRRATGEMVEYFGRLVEERRRRPGPDLLSGLVQAEEAGDRLTERELLATCVLLYVAGHETTVNLIGNGLLALCDTGRSGSVSGTTPPSSRAPSRSCCGMTGRSSGRAGWPRATPRSGAYRSRRAPSSSACLAPRIATLRTSPSPTGST